MISHLKVMQLASSQRMMSSKVSLVALETHCWAPDELSTYWRRYMRLCLRTTRTTACTVGEQDTQCSIAEASIAHMGKALVLTTWGSGS